MRKLLFPLLAILLFTSCEKQISTEKVSEEIAGAAANKQAKFTVCHYDAITGTSKTIEVTQNALSGHLSHGDLLGDCSAVLTTICDQDWMVKNMDVDHYRNGDPIPQVTDPEEWHELTTGAWCYYNNDPANGAIYGKLYNWYAINDPRGLAPVGWHVPSHAEWFTLSDCLEYNLAGGKMKTTGTIEAGTGLWYDPNTGATNSSGFTGLPAGVRFDIETVHGQFQTIGRAGVWWSSTEYESDNNFAYEDQVLYSRSSLDWDIFKKTNGFSVRCVRD